MNSFPIYNQDTLDEIFRGVDLRDMHNMLANAPGGGEPRRNPSHNQFKYHLYKMVPLMVGHAARFWLSQGSQVKRERGGANYKVYQYYPYFKRKPFFKI